MKTISTTCGYCGCGCGIDYTVSKNGNILAVSPQEHHPVGQGKLCAKGWTGHAFVHHPDRLTSPLVQTPSGKFMPISWDEALRLMAKRFTTIKNTHGPERIAVFSSARCTNEENYLMARLTRAAFSSPNIDHCARL